MKDSLVDRFGPAVLALPEDEGFGRAAYLVPLLAALGAAAALVTVARRWRRRPAEAPGAPARLDPEEARRLERKLTAHDKRAFV